MRSARPQPGTAPGRAVVQIERIERLGADYRHPSERPDTVPIAQRVASWRLDLTKSPRGRRAARAGGRETGSDGENRKTVRGADNTGVQDTPSAVPP